ITDIGARNEKHKKNNSKNNRESGRQRSRLIKRSFPKRHQSNAMTPICLGILGLQSFCNRRNFFLRLFEGYTGFERTKSFNPTRSAIFKLVSAGLKYFLHRNGDPELDRPAQERPVKAFRCHTDNRMRNAVQHLRLSNDFRIAVKALLPYPV